jgi:hypothetical protein
MSDMSVHSPFDASAWKAARSTAPSPEQDKVLKEMKSRDAEVKAHEQAHLAASGGAATGGAQFSYQAGPDGKRYATGGEVNIRIRSGKTPDETIRNAQQVERAALAPAKPSGQDLQVASEARRMQVQARAESRSEESGKEPGQTKFDSPYKQLPKGNMLDIIA